MLTLSASKVVVIGRKCSRMHEREQLVRRKTASFQSTISCSERTAIVATSPIFRRLIASKIAIVRALGNRVMSK
jgi:hypothetical protein